VNEVVFFHRPSKTLIATDLAFNVGASSPFPTRFAFRLARAYGRLSPTLLERLMIRDRAAFRRSLKRILEWPFERVVVAHGEVSETGGRGELERGYAFVLGSER
jgi:glyoxylase-like metal-dependent hydrolase (beta-lactamase superfamily II)